jgi:hypothetical protein
MTPEQVKAFHDDLAAVLLKHDVPALVGLWFSNKRSTGAVQLCHPMERDLNFITSAMLEKLRGYLTQIKPDVPIINVSHMHQGSADKN